MQAVAVGAATHAASLSEGSQKLNSLETLEPFKKAMMQALARRRLLDDQACTTIPPALLLQPYLDNCFAALLGHNFDMWPQAQELMPMQTLL